MNLMVIGLWMIIIGDPTFLSFSDLLRTENAISYNYVYRHITVMWVAVASWIESIS